MEKEEVTVYKARKGFILDNALVLIFPFILTIITYTEGGAAKQNEWIGVGGFWIVGLLITFLPLGSRLEVGKDYIKTYLFGFTTTSKIYCSDVQVIEYGRLFRGGMGYGKGLKLRALKKGRNRAFNISERVYGKEAIEHAKRVLEQKS